MRSRTRSLWSLLGVFAIWLAVAGQHQLSRREFVLAGLALLGADVVLFLVTVMSLPQEQPQLWPDNHEVQHDDRVALLDGRWQRVILALVVVFASIAFLSLAKNRYTPRGVVFWWAAVLAFLLGTAHGPSREITIHLPSRQAVSALLQRKAFELRAIWAMLALVGLLALSVFLRVYRI